MDTPTPETPPTIDPTTEKMLNELRALVDRLLAQKEERDERLRVLDELEQRRIGLCIQKLELQNRQLEIAVEHAEREHAERMRIANALAARVE